MLGFRVIGDCDKIDMPAAKVLFICLMKGMCIRLSILIIIMYARSYSCYSMLQNYALRHILSISDLGESLQKSMKKELLMFGGYVVKQ